MPTLYELLIRNDNFEIVNNFVADSEEEANTLTQKLLEEFIDDDYYAELRSIEYSDLVQVSDDPDHSIQSTELKTKVLNVFFKACTDPE